MIKTMGCLGRTLDQQRLKRIERASVRASELATGNDKSAIAGSLPGET